MPFLPGKEVAMINQKSTGEVGGRVKVSEVVFFGRMEVRKGLVLFADALDILAVTAPELSKNLKVSFLGRGSTVGGEQSTAYLDQRARSANWPFKFNYITHKDRKGALEYVRQSGRLVVIPSLVDNAPYTLYECLYTRTPFIASDLPSIAALVRPEDRVDVLFTPTPVALSLKLQSALSEGAMVVRYLECRRFTKFLDIFLWHGLYYIASTFPYIQIGYVKSGSTRVTRG
jgi:glycosyltransferase involved in cell wall biosynthesis